MHLFPFYPFASSTRCVSRNIIGPGMARLLALALLFAIEAPAAVIYSGIQNIPIATTFDGTFLNVETGAHNTSPVVGTDVNFIFGGVGMINEATFQPVRTTSGDANAPMVNLTLGTLISSTSLFASGVGSSGDFGSEHLGAGLGQFHPNVDGYIGFRLNGSNYGWMRVSFTFDEPGAVIRDWAFNDSGGSIFAGMIPEPSRALLMMLGMGGMMLRRRRIK
jgi:hypothetical protein